MAKFVYRVDGKVVSRAVFVRAKAKRRKFEGDGSGVPGVETTWSKPLRSDAAGMPPWQIDEAQQYLAQHGVHTDYDRKTGEAIFTSRAHRAAHCKAMGLIDHDGGYRETFEVPRHDPDPEYFDGC